LAAALRVTADAGTAASGDDALLMTSHRKVKGATMKRSLTILSLLAACLFVVAVGQASAARKHAAALTPVTVVMHDPGCHWFSVNGAFKTKLTVKGPAQLANLDEAALKIVGAKGTFRAAVGKKIVLKAGAYRITMVGQAPDDNTLRLVVK
jgi:hypothetical protein